jgi:hypothetical protein
VTSVKPWVTFAGCVLVIAVLYWAQAVLVPIALAAAAGQGALGSAQRLSPRLVSPCSLTARREQKEARRLAG